MRSPLAQVGESSPENCGGGLPRVPEPSFSVSCRTALSLLSLPAAEAGSNLRLLKALRAGLHVTGSPKHCGQLPVAQPQSKTKESHSPHQQAHSWYARGLHQKPSQSKHPLNLGSEGVLWAPRPLPEDSDPVRRGLLY